MKALCGAILAGTCLFVAEVRADDFHGGRPTGELQEKAQALADLAVKEGMQGALQFCAFKDGKCIVDVWAGTMTTNAGAAKIDGDTLFPIFSTEKPMLATAVHRSVEQGKLEYDKPVSAYWPEFGGGGKERLTPRLLLAYRSGLPDIKPEMKWSSLSEMSDWKGMLDWYASCDPEIEPGTKQRYMPKSYGWALGGLLEKAWGRSANDILREQVLVPAGITNEFFFTCGDEEIGRVASVYKGTVFETMNSDIARRSLLPSVWAVSSARGIAMFYNRLCGFDGKPPLVKKETLDEALKPCRHESDPVPDAEGLKKWHMIFGMGYGLWGESDDISRVFGHGGVGGSEGLCDRSQRLVVGYTCNFDNAPPKLREAFYSLVGIRWRYWKDDVNIQDLQMATASSGLGSCSIVAIGDGFTNSLVRTESGWSDGAVTVSVDGDGSVSVRSPGKGLSSVSLSWNREWPDGALFLNDAWERSYGELEWRPLSGGEIVSPWYFLAAADGKTSGIGVETQPNALACWKIGKDGFSLTLDVRAGGRPVRLGDRVLRACRIVRSESTAGESAWQFGRRFCRMMCPKPRLPKSPVYGYNDWYCAYGKNTATNFLADAEYVVSCAKGCDSPPYVVMDDGWQKNSPPVVGESGRGPWDAAGPNFGMDMPEFCRAIAALGAKPGLWYRPLRAWDELPEGQRLLANGKYLDPTVPSVRSRIVEEVRRFREWGFKLVKIDFLSYDIAQLWPCDPRPFPELFIQDGRAWRDDSRTTAEVMLDLYRAMKEAAGDDVVIIGCNALNHLAAGVFELQRTGDDTSGKDWNRTRKNGVNTLAMRSIQDGAFFKVDADCVGLASEGAVPWSLNRQWMELLGKSGTPMFVSWRRELATTEVRKVLSDMFKLASSVREASEPLDWFETRQPRHWRFVDGVAEDYDWQLHDTNSDKESKTLPVKDVSYVTEGDAYRLARCKLSLRIPDETGFPTVVWFHGGGLTGGGRHFLEIDRKIGIVAVDYRLMNATNGVQGADCIEDAAAAVAWTMKHIAEYGGDTNKVFVSGMSAGGYLTMMVGMAPAYLAKHGFKPTDLAGIVPISGQATKHFAVRKFAGDKDPQFLPKIDELAPLQWVGADLPPILDVCGQPPYEWKCRSEENRLLVASCVALGHKNARFVECPYCDHGRVFHAALPYLEFFVLGRMP